MTDQQQKLTTYHARARYYLTEYVEETITAGSPDDALVELSSSACATKTTASGITRGLIATTAET